MTAKELAVGQVWRKGEHAIEIINMGDCRTPVRWKLIGGSPDDTWRQNMIVLLDGWTLDVPPAPEIKFRAGQVWCMPGSYQTLNIVCALDDGRVVFVDQTGELNYEAEMVLRHRISAFTLSPESQAKEPRA